MTRYSYRGVGAGGALTNGELDAADNADAFAKLRRLGIVPVAVDVADDKLELARQLGAEVTVNARSEDPVAAIQEQTGGTHAVLVTAVHP
ncbi:MAG TPA: zinc-binding dehydrogenase, partial [Polymorphobacter sp.]|nr:zinc-binding dehydrogenase [Polymorphobacter sp.]